MNKKKNTFENEKSRIQNNRWKIWLVTSSVWKKKGLFAFPSCYKLIPAITYLNAK